MVTHNSGPGGNSVRNSTDGSAQGALNLSKTTSFVTTATRSMLTQGITLILTGKSGSSAKIVISGFIPIAK